MSANWFIALPVAAGAWFDGLQPPEAVRLFGRSDLHVTVAFLGPVGEQRARSAFEHAQAFPLAPLDVRLGALECLGSKRRPSAFSALLLDGRLEVEAALAAVRAQMWEAAQARADTRPPLAHVTLARPSRRASKLQYEHAVRWAMESDLAAPSVRLDSVALYTWSEDRAAALFRVVESLPLRAVNPAAL